MQEKLIVSYEALKAEVAGFRDKVRNLLAPGTKEEELYKGTIILYSELLFQPDFLFVGINPGAGFFKNTGLKYRDDELDPEEGFEYLVAENNYDYSLARQTREAFGRTNCKESLSRSVKTNLFFTSTTKASELHTLYEILLNKYNLDYYKKSAEWIKRLIQILQPHAIICEGKQAADSLGSYYKVVPSWKNDVASFEIEGFIPVLGYKRRYSTFRNMNSFSAALNELTMHDDALPKQGDL